MVTCPCWMYHYPLLFFPLVNTRMDQTLTSTCSITWLLNECSLVSMGRPESRPIVSVLYSGVSRSQEQLLECSYLVCLRRQRRRFRVRCIDMNAEGYISDKMGRKFGMVIINESPPCLTLLLWYRWALRLLWPRLPFYLLHPLVPMEV